MVWHLSSSTSMMVSLLDPQARDLMIAQLQAPGLNLKVKHNLKYCLSCQGLFNKDETNALLGQPHLIKKIEKTFGEEENTVRLGKTLGTPGQILNKPQKEEEALSVDQQHCTRRGVGMLLHLVKHFRPNIPNAVRELMKFMDKDTAVSHKEMLRVVKFCVAHKGLGTEVVSEHKLRGHFVGVVAIV
jgi:hypothetical protein